MSENREGGWVAAFFLGFLLGVLLCLGAGGTFVFVQRARLVRDLERARMDAEVAREEAMRHRYLAEEQRHQAEERLAQAEAAVKAAVKEAKVEPEK